VSELNFKTLVDGLGRPVPLPTSCCLHNAWPCAGVSERAELQDPRGRPWGRPVPPPTSFSLHNAWPCAGVSERAELQDPRGRPGAVLYQSPSSARVYALILRSLTVLEGLALYADPNFKVLAAAYPYFAKRLLTDSNPYLRDALVELLFKDGSFRWNRLENLLMQSQKDQGYR